MIFVEFSDVTWRIDGLAPGVLPLEPVQREWKINVDTDNRMAITGAIRQVLAESPSEFDPRAYLKPARSAMKQVCIARMTAFGQAGQASRMRH